MQRTNLPISDLPHGMREVQAPTRLPRQKSFDTTKKRQWCRDQVMDLFVQNRAGSKRICLFSLPGERWSFENEVAHEFSVNAKFTGVERNDQTFLKSAGYMPGRRKRFWTMETPAGTLDICVSKMATSFRCRAVDLLCASRQFGGKLMPNPSDRRAWYSLKCRNNAFWLDTCNVLSHDTLLSISRLYAWTRFSSRLVPVALTFMRGRDGFKSDRDRRDVLVSAASQGHATFELLRWENYSGIGGSPMCLVTGLLKLSPEDRQREAENSRKLRSELLAD